MRPPTPPPRPQPDQQHQEKQEPPPPQPPLEQRQVRRLIVEVIDARELLPKDGQGSSSPYVIVDFDGQRRRTSTKYRDLNPTWNEALDFIVTDPNTMEYEELNIEVYNDKRMTSGGGRKNHFLGRVKLYGSQFGRRGEEGLIYFPLEKKSVFSWVRGEIGLRIYYFDDIVEEGPVGGGGGGPPPDGGGPPPDGGGGPPREVMEIPPETRQGETRVMEVIVPTEVAMEASGPPPTSPSTPHVTTHHHPPPVPSNQDHQHPPHYHPPPHHHHQEHPPPPPHHQYPPHDMHQPHQEVVHMPPPTPDMRRMSMGGGVDRTRVLRRTNCDYSPKIINGNFTGESEKMSSFDLVEPMQYLFVRIVKARGLAPNESPVVKIRSSNHIVRSKPAAYRPGEPPENPEWQQVFALAQPKECSAAATLELSIWDAPNEHFLGGVCFDLSDVPVRDPPDSPLAPQWYHLEDSATAVDPNRVTGDIQLAVWIGTQADEAFPEAWCSDAPPSVSYTRSKVYQSPKLWYLRVTIIEAQELHIPPNLPPLTVPDIRVKGLLAFQSARTRRGSMNSHGAAIHWNEDLIFVAGEPLEDKLILLVEDRTAKDPMLLGHVMIPLAAIEQRLDERHVAAKWVNLLGGDGAGGPYSGRIHLRACLEGGYHVLDEATHVCSDFRPTAKQLWKPAVGILELGILGARGLLPMKTKGSGKRSTDPYCVAKYGKKWVRTRTITDCFDPRWNEQYTWQVYDPCTVLTIGVFDNWRMFADMGEDNKPDFRIGKVRIRISTLESNKVYKNSYPLLILLPNGLKKMGEIDIAVRFACPSLLPDTCSIYRQPLLPRMHYLKPLGVAQQEALRGSATKMVAAWLARSEPPLGPEVVRYMLDTDSHAWSMRKSKANWLRIVAVLAWAVGLAKWLDNIKRWRNPITTMLVHVLYLVLVWFPDLIVPTGFLYIFLIGIWYYRFKPKIPAGMDTKLSQAETVDLDELDEEFDTIPSSRPPDIVRARYDKLRILAARVQTVLGDLATQGERVQALVGWRDPRATKLFIGVCLIVTITLYAVPPKMVAVALGFYFLRHPMFREPMPPSSLNFFRRLPSLSDRLI